VAGEVAILRAAPDGPRVITTQGAGTIVGQMSLVERRPRTASVRALSDVTALEFSRDVFDALLEACSPFAIRFQEQIAVAGIRQLRGATERLLEAIGPASYPPPPPATQDALRDFFRPEFINRIEEIVMFNPLDVKVCERIAGNMLREVSDLLKKRGITTTFSPGVRVQLAKLGFSEEFGARELKRHMTQAADPDHGHMRRW
jgi:CRP-like cAMP-binding protein